MKRVDTRPEIVLAHKTGPYVLKYITGYLSLYRRVLIPLIPRYSPFKSRRPSESIGLG